MSNIYKYALIWLLLPLFLFMGGWLKPVFSVPIIAGLIYVVYKYLSSSVLIGRKQKTTINIFKCKSLWICILIIGLWILLCGLGGFTFQEKWDNTYRNAIFYDLINYDWPVVGFENDTAELLCYYFAFWLPPAIVAKLTGSITVGMVALTVYGSIGVYLAWLMTARYVGRISAWLTVMFILFAGWDIVGWLLFDKFSLLGLFRDMKDLSYLIGSYPSATIQLAFIYNQGIAVWIATLLMLRLKDNPGYILPVYVSLGFFSPIGAAGCFVAVAAILLANLRKSMTISNLVAVICGLIILAFYSTNSRSALGTYPICINSLIRIVLFLIFTFGVYLPFVWKDVRHDKIFWLLFAPIPALLWIKLGETNDFSWRVCLVPGFYMMLKVMRAWANIKTSDIRRKALMATVIIIGWSGALTVALHNVYGNYTVMAQGAPARAESLPSTFMPNRYHDNFVTSNHSFFTDYLMREPQ